MTAALPLDELVDDEPPRQHLDIDVHDLWLHLRLLGGARWSQDHTDAAYRRLMAALSGDTRTAVAYLEHMARKNRFLFGWLASTIGGPELAYNVIQAVGKTPAVEFEPLRIPKHEPVTLDEVLDQCLVATTYERVQIANRAQDSGLYAGNRIYDAACDRIFDLQTLLINHLTTDDGPRARLDGEPENIGAHRRADLRRATEDDEARIADRLRREGQR